MQLEHLEKLAAGWRESRVARIDLGGLYARNNTAHKWKATYRCIVLRELVLWRFTDLMTQVAYLLRVQHILGARILIRSAMETLGILIFLSQKMRAVLEGKINFFDFAKVTSQLMLGSKNQTTSYATINIVTVLKHCNADYPGIENAYAELSESAHPNFEGVCAGYSVIDEKEYRTEFKNRWAEQSGARELDLLEVCVRTFESEYNEVWPHNYEKLEEWLVANDTRLEQEKGKH